MNSTPCSASTAQKRSSGLCSSGSSKLLHPQRGPSCALRPARPLRRRDAHVRADGREVHAALVVLSRRPERPGRGWSAGRGIAAGARHRRHSTGPVPPQPVDLWYPAGRHLRSPKETIAWSGRAFGGSSVARSTTPRLAITPRPGEVGRRSRRTTTVRPNELPPVPEPPSFGPDPRASPRHRRAFPPRPSTSAACRLRWSERSLAGRARRFVPAGGTKSYRFGGPDRARHQGRSRVLPLCLRSVPAP